MVEFLKVYKKACMRAVFDIPYILICYHLIGDGTGPRVVLDVNGNEVILEESSKEGSVKDEVIDSRYNRKITRSPDISS